MTGRLAKALKLAPEGARLSFGILLAGIVALGFGFPVAGGIVIALGLAVASFFRDPERFPARTAGVVISGADGRVTDISESCIPGEESPQYHRVSVFMSPLNVHVNRAPSAGEVVTVEHTPGEFRAAYHDHSSQHNERNLIVIRDDAGRRHGMMQVAGYLARRIVCRVRVHDRIEAGQRIGLIMFGSRVDHFVPPEYRVTVTIGERVRAGETVIGEIRE
jgi:phosphatidylserine decarboxylase